LTEPILGWDIGGSNIKAALVIDEDEPAVVERPFAIWRERDRLPEVLADVAGGLAVTDTMAVTMTAELADCFATKREGVSFVLDALRRAFPGSELRVFGASGGFLSPDDARRAPLEVAAANWMASAITVALRQPDAIFIDVGSTTTDIIPIVSGRVAAVGLTDSGRLESGGAAWRPSTSRWRPTSTGGSSESATPTIRATRRTAVARRGGNAEPGSRELCAPMSICSTTRR
jgi:hypothetical protein